jgi:NADH-quinone oxidoreductase subunit N
VWVLAVLSMVVGSVLAVVQSDVKRMLAYSSISHAGFILIGLQAANDRGIAGSLFYLLAYSFLVLGSFATVAIVSRRGDLRTGLDSYRGLSRDRPGLALAFTVFLLAQAGVPFTSGFLAKFYVISAAVEAESYAIAIIAMLASVVAAFFYLRLIVVMYMSADQTMAGVGPEPSMAASTVGAAAAGGDGEGGGEGGGGRVATAPLARVDIPVAAAIAIGICLAYTIGSGLIPQPFIDFARHATLLRL